MFTSIMGDENVISAIVSEDDWSQGRFRINPYTNKLQYKIEKDIVETIDNLGSKDRACKGSDVLNELKSRNFNLTDSKGIDPVSKELSFISEYDEDGCASRYEVISNVMTDINIEEFTSLQSDLLNMQIGYIPNTYLADGTGDYSSPENYKMKSDYYNFRVIRDFVNKSTVVNVLTMNEIEYTDFIDLKSVKSFSLNETDSVSVKVGIQYTISESNVVYTKEFMFKSGNDLEYNINNKVKMQVIDNCIRLFPISDDVVESIISYCHLYYEQLI